MSSFAKGEATSVLHTDRVPSGCLAGYEDTQGNRLTPFAMCASEEANGGLLGVVVAQSIRVHAFAERYADKRTLWNAKLRP